MFSGMLTTIFLLTCFLLIQGNPVEPLYENDTRPLCPCAKSHSVNTRVVGGRAVGRNRFPFASELGFASTDEERSPHVFPYCGGTLISDRHILTAAHCLNNKTPAEVLVDVGDYSLSNGTDGTITRAQRFIQFPRYNPPSFNHDMGIVELERPIPFETGIRAAPLPSRDLKLDVGTTVTVFGWGRLSYEGETPDKLNAVELPVIDNGECQTKFVSRIEPTMICAGGEEGKDACIGDSGSGLVIQLANQYVICGVVSFGKRCALPHVPGVYTRVSSFVDWILEQTKTSDCRPCIYGQDE